MIFSFHTKCEKKINKRILLRVFFVLVFLEFLISAEGITIRKGGINVKNGETVGVSGSVADKNIVSNPTIDKRNFGSDSDLSSVIDYSSADKSSIGNPNAKENAFGSLRNNDNSKRGISSTDNFLPTTTVKREKIAFNNDNELPIKTSKKEKYFTNGWAVRLEGGNTDERIKTISKKYGFEKITKIGSLDGYYHLEHPLHPKRSKRSSESKTELLKKDSEIAWVEQQHEYKRTKRGLHHQRIVTRGIGPRFADPLWDEQWYLDDKRAAMDLDVNVIPVWNAGISGKGVVVTILDDGIEHNHTDLKKNYDPAASWDVNDNDPDPMPRYDPTNENKHGTRCAGEVAAQANNTVCGVGVAYNARIGGVRMLDGRVTDRVEAESLSLNPQYIDIYSASWGPSDDGQTVEGPGTLATAAFLNGITKGRGGRGSIYVWASGNGGRHDDSCNCDGYTASIYTLSISSSSDHGESPWYSEACASTLATTLSSGAHGEKRIVTTDLHNQCTERHTGTSASAPLAAGIVALALERNPKLTWRDIQHVVANTASWIPLKNDPDWRMNGIGLHVNEKFGFGLLDSERIVHFADPATFKTVPLKRECVGKTFEDLKLLRWNQALLLEIESDGCVNTKNEIRYLEHVQLVLTIDYTRRGDLTIFLTTPMGTRSCLLPVRSEDSSDEGFHSWTFMTTHAWGEDPRGKWVLEIKDGGESRKNTGYLKSWQLILHGTKEKPNHQNITHPDIPIHRKAVPDDVKNGGRSSVQITQITYTFGNQGALQTYIPSPSEPQRPSYMATNTPTDPIPTYSAGLQTTQPSYSASLPNAQNNIRMDFSQTFNYNSNTNNNDAYTNNNPYTRTSIAQAYGEPSYSNIFATSQQQQQLPQTINYAQAFPPQMSSNPIPNTYNDQTSSNLWDFFGRINNGRRSLDNQFYDDNVIENDTVEEADDNEDDEMVSQNSFLKLVHRLRRVER